MSVQTSEASATSTEHVDGVMINCDGVKKATGVRFKSFKIDKNHPVFSEPECELSARVGMSIKIMRYPNQTSLNLSNTGDKVNQRATFLKRRLDPAKTSFAFAPMKWQDSCGNVLAVRSDMGQLTPDDLKILTEFAMIRLGTLMQDYIEEGLEWVVMEEEMSRAAFKRYTLEHEWRERERGQGEY